MYELGWLTILSCCVNRGWWWGQPWFYIHNLRSRKPPQHRRWAV